MIENVTDALNIPLDAAMRTRLAQLAAKRGKPLAAVALEMLEDALERDEDLYFSRLAEEREGEDLIPHDQAW